jgi:hypothetical protein
MIVKMLVPRKAHYEAMHAKILPIGRVESYYSEHGVSSRLETLVPDSDILADGVSPARVASKRRICEHGCCRIAVRPHCSPGGDPVKRRPTKAHDHIWLVGEVVGIASARSLAVTALPSSDQAWQIGSAPESGGWRRRPHAAPPTSHSCMPGTSGPEARRVQNRAFRRVSAGRVVLAFRRYERNENIETLY